MHENLNEALHFAFHALALHCKTDRFSLHRELNVTYGLIIINDLAAKRKLLTRARILTMGFNPKEGHGIRSFLPKI